MPGLLRQNSTETIQRVLFTNTVQWRVNDVPAFWTKSSPNVSNYPIGDRKSHSFAKRSIAELSLAELSISKFLAQTFLSLLGALGASKLEAFIDCWTSDQFNLLEFD